MPFGAGGLRVNVDVAFVLARIRTYCQMRCVHALDECVCKCWMDACKRWRVILRCIKRCNHDSVHQTCITRAYDRLPLKDQCSLADNLTP